MKTYPTVSMRPLALIVLLVFAWITAASSANAQTCGLLTNGGFESDLTGWTNAGSTTITTDIHSGSKAARIGTGQGGVNRTGLKSARLRRGPAWEWIFSTRQASRSVK
jgi:hypothetical protein